LPIRVVLPKPSKRRSPTLSMNEAEAVLAQRLRRMRWLATGLLLAMLVVFVLTSWLEPAHPWLGLPRAFAEAATVGALADWFAVTALFRRPMGLPIPHTAIVPTRKDAIGQALARFVRVHFLVRETVQRRLSRANLAERLGGWLGREDNARAMSRDLARASRWLIEAVDGSDVRSALRTGIRDALEEAPLNTGLAVMVEVLASGRHAQTLIDHLVQFGREQLENNKPRIRERIRERSPWWLPRFVDEQIYDQLVGEFERILNEIGDDPAHEARIQFKERLSALRRSLEEDPRLSGKTSALLNEILDHPAVSAYLRELGQRLKTYQIASLDDAQTALRSGVEGQIRAERK